MANPVSPHGINFQLPGIGALKLQRHEIVALAISAVAMYILPIISVPIFLFNVGRIIGLQIINRPKQHLPGQEFSPKYEPGLEVGIIESILGDQIEPLIVVNRPPKDRQTVEIPKNPVQDSASSEQKFPLAINVIPPKEGSKSDDTVILPPVPLLLPCCLKPVVRGSTQINLEIKPGPLPTKIDSKTIVLRTTYEGKIIKTERFDQIERKFVPFCPLENKHRSFDTIELLNLRNQKLKILSDYLLAMEIAFHEARYLDFNQVSLELYIAVSDLRIKFDAFKSSELGAPFRDYDGGIHLAKDVECLDKLIKIIEENSILKINGIALISALATHIKSLVVLVPEPHVAS